MTDPSVKRQRQQISLLLVLCLAVFLNTLTNGFVWDDIPLIAENRYIRNLNNIPLFFTPAYWETLHPFATLESQYRPLRTVTFAVDYFFWGLSPAGYHLTNLLLHMANVVLIFLLVAALVHKAGCRNTGGRLMGLPFLTAALFAVHPIHTETVTYIKNRSELLAAVFFLLAFLLFIRRETAGRRIKRLLLLSASLLCSGLAILSKETALTLPLALGLYLLCFRDNGRGRGVGLLTLYVGVMLAYAGFRLMLGQTDLSPAGFQLTVVQHVLAVIKTLGTYFGLMAWPVNLSADRPFLVPESIREPAVIFSLASLVLAGLIGVVSWRRSRIVFFAVAFIFLTLLPAGNIVFLASRPLAEQRLYLPSLGFCLLAAALIRVLYQGKGKEVGAQKRATAAWVLFGLMAVGYGVVTVDRNRDWQDPVTLYARTLADNPDNARMHDELATALAEQGRHREALAHYRTALRLQPGFVRVYNNLGAELAEAGRLEEAVRHYETALEIEPNYAAAHYNLAAVLLRTGKTDDAIRHFETAARLKPDAEKLNNLGSAYAAAGRLEEAAACYLAVLRIAPEVALAFDNLGAVLVETGEIEKTAERLLADGLSDRQMARVYNSVAGVYVKSDDYRTARAFSRRALALDPGCRPCLHTLGLVMGLDGDYRAAAEVYGRILALDPSDAVARRGQAYCRQMARP